MKYHYITLLKLLITNYPISYVNGNIIKNTIQLKSVINNNCDKILVSLLLSTNTIKYYK